MVCVSRPWVISSQEVTFSGRRWEIATAAVRAGIVLCPCTTLAVAKDIEFRSQMSGATIFVGNEQSIRNFLQVKQSCPKVKIIIQVSGTPLEQPDICQYEAKMQASGLDSAFSGPKTLSSDPALIYFTSGTTGMPKMVLHNQVSYPLGILMQHPARGTWH